MSHARMLSWRSRCCLAPNLPEHPLHILWKQRGWCQMVVIDTVNARPCIALGHRLCQDSFLDTAMQDTRSLSIQKQTVRVVRSQAIPRILAQL